MLGDDYRTYFDLFLNFSDWINYVTQNDKIDHDICLEITYLF